jgi:predicted esterase
MNRGDRLRSSALAFGSVVLQLARRSWLRNARTLAVAFAAAACAPSTSESLGGETHWIDVEEGDLKAQVFKDADVVDRPILVLVLHGDLPNPRPDYQYLFAKMLTLPNEPEAWASLRAAFPADWSDERIAGVATAIRAALGSHWNHQRVVAAGILRPGYTDPSGDRSFGDMGMAVGDNYTPEVVDAVATAARRLAIMYNASAVVLVGHSGGAAIAANVLGRHPDSADSALLVACGCDPEAWRARMHAQQPDDAIWAGVTSSLLPLSLVDGVGPEVQVRLLVGEADDVALPDDSRKYAGALQARGIDARLNVVPGLGHNILMTPDAFRELSALIGELEP